VRPRACNTADPFAVVWIDNDAEEVRTMLYVMSTLVVLLVIAAVGMAVLYCRIDQHAELC
jgi:biotin transporter BioY